MKRTLKSSHVPCAGHLPDGWLGRLWRQFRQQSAAPVPLRRRRPPSPLTCAITMSEDSVYYRTWRLPQGGAEQADRLHHPGDIQFGGRPGR